ncbi:hypothetical protein [Lactobacillus taiwanensis]|uniref:hypothetical protein n=2 Tax=Lactobacillus taiwanensis TaxID=508451 RepID=UPI00129D6021|nr:hypothetical protein [Lactobacillus taiwanensis]MRM98104.1 hypothetical protein [Lactobacillus taiwanensis]
MNDKEVLLTKTKYAYYCASKLVDFNREINKISQNIASLKDNFRNQVNELSRQYNVEDNVLNNQIIKVKNEIDSLNDRVQELKQPVNSGFQTANQNFLPYKSTDDVPEYYGGYFSQFLMRSFGVLSVVISILFITIGINASKPPKNAVYTVPITPRYIFGLIALSVVVAFAISLVLSIVVFPILKPIKVSRYKRKWVENANKTVDLENARIKQEIANVNAHNERQKAINAQKEKENLQLCEKILEKIEKLENEIEELNKSRSLLSDNQNIAISILNVTQEKSIFVLIEHQKKIETIISDIKKKFSTDDVINVSKFPVDHRYDVNYYVRMYDVIQTEQATTNGEAIKIVDEQLRDEKRDKLLQTQIDVFRESMSELDRSIREVGFGMQSALNDSTEKINRALDKVNQNNIQGTAMIKKAINNVESSLNINLQTLNDTVVAGTQSINQNLDNLNTTVAEGAVTINEQLMDNNALLRDSNNYLKSINSPVVSIDRTAVGIKASNYAVAGAALTAANSLQSIYNKL